MILHPRRQGLALLCVVLLGIAGCGDDNEVKAMKVQGAGTPPPAGATPPAPPPKDQMEHHQQTQGGQNKASGYPGAK